MIDADGIAALIPHGHDMALLARVRDWTPTRIVCEADSHRAANNPLALDGVLYALAGIEYAAQAMAVHGGLSGTVGVRPRSGYIASLRDVRFFRARLDEDPAPLTIEAEKLAGDGVSVMYRFSVKAPHGEILSGRAAVVLEGDPS